MDFHYIIHKFNVLGKHVSDESYELSRRAFIIEGMIANIIYTFTSGAFLVGYAKYLGANDQYTGIVVALPLLSYILQMFSPVIIERLRRRKKLVSILCIFYRLLLGAMILIPIITDNKSIRLLLLGIMYFTSYMVFSFLNPAAASWLISLVPEQMRGSYFGFRDMCILSVTAVFTLTMGSILDAFKSNSQEFSGFVFMYSLVLVLVIFNFLILRKIREPRTAVFKRDMKLKDMLVMPVKDPKFRNVIILNSIWNLSAQLSIPFFSVYMVNGLKLTYTFIMVMGIIMSCTQSLAAKMWGKFSEKAGWETTTAISIALVGLSHISWVFTSSYTYFFLIPLIQILSGVAWAGANLSFFNIQFKYAPQKGRTMFIGFNAAAAGLAGFSSALIGAVLVGELNGMKVDIRITVIDNMRFIFGLSGILIVICSIFASKVFKRTAPNTLN